MPQTLFQITADFIFNVLVDTFASAAVGSAALQGFYIAAQVIAAAVLAAASYGLSALLAPSGPKASDGQVTINQPIPFRRRVYGRAKMGGYMIFFQSQNGTLYTLVALAAHECDAMEELWLADRHVTVDGSNAVTMVVGPSGAEAGQFNPHGDKPVYIYTRLGAPGQASYARLISDFPSLWTTDHVGTGITDALVVLGGVKGKDFANTYPGGNQNFRGVLRGAKIKDPRSLGSAAAWSDNAIAVIYDYLTHPDGFRIDASFFNTGLGLEITKAACDIADEEVELVSGGTEKRYRIWGFYDFSEEPRVVLNRMLAAAGAWLEPQADGTIGIRAGAWIEPDFTISDDYIISYTVQHYTGEFDSINEVRATFTYPDNDYQDTESSPWQDAADITRRGYVRSTTLDARHCPSFTQCRRIQKIGMHEASPEWSIQIVTGPYGLLARGKRFIRVQIAELGIDITCRVTQFVVDVRTGACQIGVQSFGSDAYAWNPSTEEGPAPAIAPSTATAGGVETPTSLTVSVLQVGTGAGLKLSCDAPVLRSDLTTLFEIQPAGASDWTPISSGGTSTLEVSTGQLLNGTYNSRVSFIAPGGTQSAYDEVDGTVVSPASVTPSAPVNLSVSGAGSPVTVAHIAFDAPNDTHFAAAKIYRHNTSVFAGASVIAGPLYGSANQNFTYDDSPGSGTWYYWATSLNAALPPSESGHTGPVSVVIP